MLTRTNQKSTSNIRKITNDPPFLELDEIIQCLQNAGKIKNISVLIKESDIQTIIQRSKAIIQNQPMLIETEGPMKICGDIHGQFSDLIHLFQLCGDPCSTRYMFLGDYIDRGRQGIETMTLLLCFKIKYPNTFFLLRGNHESQAVSRVYGFFDECKRRFNIKLWKSFLDLFNYLPIAAILENQIFCCHGGLSPDMMRSELKNLENLKQKIKSLSRPIDIPEDGLVCDILWSDPQEQPSAASSSDYISSYFSSEGFAPNERGISYVFSQFVVDNFLKRFALDLIIRAHQVVEDGYEFFANRSFVTIFSAPNYCGEFDNAGAVFCLSRSTSSNLRTKEENVDLEGSFKILYPEYRRKVLTARVKNQSD